MPFLAPKQVCQPVSALWTIRPSGSRQSFATYCTPVNAGWKESSIFASRHSMLRCNLERSSHVSCLTLSNSSIWKWSSPVRIKKEYLCCIGSRNIESAKPGCWWCSQSLFLLFLLCSWVLGSLSNLVNSWEVGALAIPFLAYVTLFSTQSSEHCLYTCLSSISGLQQMHKGAPTYGIQLPVCSRHLLLHPSFRLEKLQAVDYQ